MRIVSLNVNGIRAAARKGFFDWLPRQSADIFCLQEVRAQLDQISDPIFSPRRFHIYHEVAEKKGYSGVALLSREEPDDVIYGFGSSEFDPEGRYIEAQFGNLSVVSVYMPSGSSSEERQAAKFRFMDEFTTHLDGITTSGRDVVICGDWNIAHKEIDIRNWRANRKNSGFLPEERAWMDELFGPQKYVDAFRAINSEESQYTWWSNRGRAWDNNVGWRLDYHVVTKGLRERIIDTEIYKAERFSDHAPITMDYDL
jgi:exodeoxyribonuclease-3